MIRLLSQCLNEILHRPFVVLLVCFVVSFTSLIVEGTLFQLWSLYQSDKEISHRMEHLEKETQKLSIKMTKASEAGFLELEANEYFDVVEEGDLVFIFSEDSK